MSYPVKDASTHDGEPIEVYKFTGPFGEYRFTSDMEPITVDGDLYEPLPITRTSIETGSVVDTIQTMDFNIPASSDLARMYAFTLSPETLTIEVKRVHRGDDYATDFEIEWTGEGLDFLSSGKWSTIKTGSILQSKLRGNLSSVLYQGICNHVLFDKRCKMVKAAWTSAATVKKIQGQIITLNSDNNSDGTLNGGEVKNVRTGEIRRIISNTAEVLRIGYKFIDIVDGDTLELTHGCNHARLGDCKTKFNNVANYGGFDFIPLKNPFVDLNKGNIAAVLTTVNRQRIKMGGLRPTYASYI
jgi:hypothetical protein